jgi:asparagine synthase (glutamine-hydrolysing)
VYYRPSKSTPCRRYAPTIVAFTDSDKEDSHSELMVAQREGSAIDLLEPYFTETDSLVSAASMARGLEARSPLLDHVLMEWAAGIPA